MVNNIFCPFFLTCLGRVSLRRIPPTHLPSRVSLGEAVIAEEVDGGASGGRWSRTERCVTGKAARTLVRERAVGESESGSHTFYCYSLPLEGEKSNKVIYEKDWEKWLEEKQRAKERRKKMCLEYLALSAGKK
jgi:hypothetical protein